MTTLLLAGCGPAGVSEAEELALTIRGEYLAMDSCAVQAAITADYGQRVYQYELAAAVAQVHEKVTAADSLEEAVEMARLLADKEDVIVAFGSLSYLGRMLEIVGGGIPTGELR